MTKKVLKNIFKILIIIFALWGLALTLVFFAMKFGWTKTGGLVDDQSSYFAQLYKDSLNKTVGNTERDSVANQGWDQIKNLQEWQVVKSGIVKDAPLINTISQQVGISPRLLIAPLVAEQLRLMTSERDMFKKYFQPLSILGSQTQFSLGIYGIKENTAKQIEANLKNKYSPYYLGSAYENILDYTDSSSTMLVDANTLEPIKNSTSSNSTTSSSTNSTSTILLSGSDAERIKRLTNEKDHTYSYLYAALYLKEIMTAWKNAGYNISDRPEIVSTVYNLGFIKSNPNANPQVGGAEIQLNGQKYSFGSIAFYFYFSDELKDTFNK